MKIVSTSGLYKTKKLITTLFYSISITWLSANLVYADDLNDIDAGHYLKIKASESLSINSNPLRLATGSDSLMGSEFSPEISLGYITQTHKVYSSTIINYNLYDDSQFDTTDFHQTIGLFKSNQRWSMGAEGSFDHDTARTSEISSFGINATGIKRTGIAISPQISFKPNSTDRISLKSNIMRLLYDESSFIGNKQYSLSPSYSHSFDPNNSGFITFNLQRYQSDNASEDRTDSIGPSLGWTSVINKELNTRVSAGFQKVKYESNLTTSLKSRINSVFSASINFKGQQDNASFTASRSQRQFGNGGSSLFTSFNIIESHALNEKIRLNTSANYSYTGNSSFSSVSLDNQFKISGGISYSLSNKIDLTTNYQYVSQKLTGSSGTIKEQILLIGVSYHPNFSPI